MIVAKHMRLLCALLLWAASPLDATISALGRILPSGGVVDIWGPSGLQVNTLHVTQGQEVEANSLLASLSNQKQVQADLEQAELALEHAKQAYALEVDVQKAILAGLEVDLGNATKRIQESYKNQDILSPQVIEDREETVSSIKNALARAQAVKKKVLTLLDLDQKLAARQLQSAQAMLASAEVRAPVDGTVLIIRKPEGGTLGPGEFIKLADLSRMSVSAEVYESDISKISIGQKVRIESNAIDGALTGTITRPHAL